MKQADKPLAAQVLINLLKLQKLSTIQKKLVELAPGEDGMIRTVLNPAGTVTGRFSSSGTDWEGWEPTTNLQNLPKKVARLDPLYDVRGVVVASPGMSLVEADLSQADARNTAAYARDMEALALFASGVDVHALTASRIFGVAPEDVTWEQRHLAKTANHALNYGMGWKKFLQEVNADAELTGLSIAAADAKRIVDAYRAGKPALLAWWGDVERKIRMHGFLRNCFGRRCDFFDISDTAIQDAIAWLPASTTADWLNMCLVRIFERYDSSRLRIVHQVHDSILFEVPKGREAEIAKLVKAAMERPFDVNGIKLLIPVEISVGQNWGEMEDLKL